MGKLDDMRNEVAIRLVTLVMYVATKRYRQALATYIQLGVDVDNGLYTEKILYDDE